MINIQPYNPTIVRLDILMRLYQNITSRSIFRQKRRRLHRRCPCRKELLYIIRTGYSAARTDFQTVLHSGITDCQWELPVTKAGGRIGIKAVADVIYAIRLSEIRRAYRIQQRHIPYTALHEQRHDVILRQIDVQLRHDGNTQCSVQLSQKRHDTSAQSIRSDQVSHIEEIKLDAVRTCCFKLLAGRDPVSRSKACCGEARDQEHLRLRTEFLHHCLTLI